MQIWASAWQDWLYAEVHKYLRTNKFIEDSSILKTGFLKFSWADESVGPIIQSLCSFREKVLFLQPLYIQPKMWCSILQVQYLLEKLEIYKKYLVCLKKMNETKINREISILWMIFYFRVLFYSFVQRIAK